MSNVLDSILINCQIPLAGVPAVEVVAGDKVFEFKLGMPSLECLVKLSIFSLHEKRIFCRGSECFLKQHNFTVVVSKISFR